MFSMPPATATSTAPDMISCAADTIACAPEVCYQMLWLARRNPSGRRPRGTPGKERSREARAALKARCAVRARRAPFAANRTSTLRVQMLQGDGGPGKALDQGALDGAQPIGCGSFIF